MSRCDQSRRARSSLALLLALVLGGVGMVLELRAQPPAPASSAIHAPSSPVAAFRELLLMTPAEQEAALAARPPEIRRRLQRKIAEYLALSPEERELRLQATELRWHLMPLLHLRPEERGAALTNVPEHLRVLVESRLRQWDELPLPMQRLLLTNQPAAGIFLWGGRAGGRPEPEIVTDPSGLSQRFHRLFELTPDEKERALRTLSEAERRQMERTLREFEQLPPEKRARCVDAFARFAALPPGEREEFLRNAERWTQMSPSEREAWRKLVSLAPVLPPPPAAGAPSTEPVVSSRADGNR
jgi:hypothetical protein